MLSAQATLREYLLGGVGVATVVIVVPSSNSVIVGGGTDIGLALLNDPRGTTNCHL